MGEKNFKCKYCEDKGYTKELCSNCSGSGEGMYDGSNCFNCTGSGSELVECEHCDIALENWMI